MASAQYETRTRTVEEKIVVLTLTEDEARALWEVVGEADGTPTMTRIYRALGSPGDSTATPDDTYEYDGVSYNLYATYRDREGDEWTFTGRRNENGVPYVTMYPGSDNTFDTIGSVVRLYAPLTKVTT
ncbi:phiSA1p31-related protein [Streptomyces scopuliridis]|uniref:PhiSA1p31-related protein n=1 Tax=Streptomyces scopuliridis TaxID=452529 RepID=A0ACD4ZTA4_9ACTN|nr:phiSA1p31-related protein [Streptomyces scopuliridis]WSC01247.1 phiSA1p31-related protein [Streptomyces scopuliridis]